MKKFEFVVDENDVRIDKYLKSVLNISRNQSQDLIKNDFVKINGNKEKTSFKIFENDLVEVIVPDKEAINLEAKDMNLDVLYEDDDLAVINKPPYLVVHPSYGHTDGNTLLNGLLYRFDTLSNVDDIIRQGIVHRLDKNTSGLIIIAKNDKSHLELKRMFKDKEIKKVYIAIVKGKMKQDNGRIETFIKRDKNDRKLMSVNETEGKLAITNYEVLKESNNYSFLKINIETGRTHQIRVHMKYLGNPILGDHYYGKKSKIADRQMLHSLKLEFLHPINKNKISVTSDIPKDMKRVLDSIGISLEDIGDLNE